MVEGSTPGMEAVAWYSMMDRMLSGFLEEAMMVFTPASVAMSAAISFVSIPPVPRLDPSVAVLTGMHTFLWVMGATAERTDTSTGQGLVRKSVGFSSIGYEGEKKGERSEEQGVAGGVGTGNE